MRDTLNPYEATLLEEEQTPKGVRFFRGNPTPKTITRKMIGEMTWQVFLSKRWKFIGLGLLQIALIYVFLIPVFVVTSLLDIFGLTRAPVMGILFFGLGLAFYFWELLTYMLIAGMNLRLLRGEKIFLKPTRQGCFRLFVTTLNGTCYALICALMLLPAYVLLIPTMVMLDQTGDMFVSNIWLGIYCLGLVIFFLLSLFVLGRYAIGLHYIADYNVGCLTALRRTSRFTRGNTVTISLSFLLHFVVLYLIGAFTLGLGLFAMPGYLHCWLAVIYLMTTGQYEKPTTPEISEW